MQILGKRIKHSCKDEAKQPFTGMMMIQLVRYSSFTVHPYVSGSVFLFVQFFVTMFGSMKLTPYNCNWSKVGASFDTNGAPVPILRIILYAPNHNLFLSSS